MDGTNFEIERILHRIMTDYLPNPDCPICYGVGEYKHDGSKVATVTCSCVRDQYRSEFAENAQKVIEDNKEQFGCDSCSRYEYRQPWHLCHGYNSEGKSLPELISQLQECRGIAGGHIPLLERRATGT